MKIQIVTQKCRRGCGRDVSGVSRSLHGANDAHAKFSGICECCTTDAERTEMNNSIASTILVHQIA